MCASCRAELPWTSAGQVLHGDHFTGAYAPLRYEGKASAALRRYKFNGRTSYAGCFAELIASCLREHQADKADVVTWVPLGRLRYIRRGYSQSKILARHLAKLLGIPARGLLTKIRETPKQSRLGSEAARRANVSGAYKAGGRAEGKRVILVDDVFTTGATVSECARMLRTAGAVSVSAAALCTANHQIKKGTSSVGRECK